jgi:hypothetical protein
VNWLVGLVGCGYESEFHRFMMLGGSCLEGSNQQCHEEQSQDDCDDSADVIEGEFEEFHRDCLRLISSMVRLRYWAALFMEVSANNFIIPKGKHCSSPLHID